MLIVSCLELVTKTITTSCTCYLSLKLLSLFINLNLAYGPLDILGTGINLSVATLYWHQFILFEIEAIDNRSQLKVSKAETFQCLCVKFDFHNVLLKNVYIRYLHSMYRVHFVYVFDKFDGTKYIFEVEWTRYYSTIFICLPHLFISILLHECVYPILT